jgi:hypothetical protein
MMAFLIDRFFGAASGALAAARVKQGARAAAPARVVRKLRRVVFSDWMVFMFASTGLLASFMRAQPTVKPTEQCETTKQDLQMD